MSIKSRDVAKIALTAGQHHTATLLFVLYSRLQRENLCIEDVARAYCEIDNSAAQDAKDLAYHQRAINEYFARLKKQVALIHKEKK